MIFNRPWIVFVQFVSGLLFSFAAWIRFAEALKLWDFLKGLPLAVSPLYHAVSGLIWGLAGLVVCFWVWQGSSKAPAALRILSVTFALYYWTNQFLVMTSDIRQTNWVFTGSVTVILVLFVFLSLKPAVVKDFYGE
jgi:hypothetical protein